MLIFTITLDLALLGLIAAFLSLVKLRYKNPVFTTFEPGKGDQYYVNRGVFTFFVDGIKVQTTHLDPKNEAARQKQLKSLDGDVIAGDLNQESLEENSPPTCAEDSFTIEHTLNYILSSKKSEQRVISTYTLGNAQSAISDHHALFATINLD